MTRKLIISSILATATALLSTPSANAQFGITAGDPNDGGIAYQFYANLGMGNTFSQSSHVGAWSWEQNTYPVNTGWTHTSNWYAITLSEPATFTISITRQENVPWPSATLPDRVASTGNMNPSFTLYGGWENTGPAATHQYTNNGNIAWSDDLTYMTHVNNSTDSSVSYSYQLPAGKFTMVIGSNAVTDATERQGYLATFSTAPAAAVPEPASALLAVVGGVAMMARRRRA